MGILVNESEYQKNEILGGGPSIIIPNEIIEDSEFRYLYQDNTDQINGVEFPFLNDINSYGLVYAFEGCSGLSGNISFPSLISVGEGGLEHTFGNCTEITNISFPALTSIDNFGLFYTFSDCTGLIGSVEFPALIESNNYGLYNTFKGCIGITEIHFRADARSVIEAQVTYDSKFGAVNATIYFDL